MVVEKCGVCKIDASVDIVCCDRCGGEFHLACVNEDTSVYSRDWLCKDCIPSAEDNVPGPTVSSSPPPSPSLHTATPCMVTPAAERAPANVSGIATPHPSMMEEISRCFRQIMEEQPRPRAGGSEVPRMEDIVNAVMCRLDGRLPQSHRGHPSSTAYGSTIDNHELSRSQLSARQAVSGKLPIFSGNPEDWAMFEGSYEETTRLCGFSDGENVIRLREALKGRALKAVQCRLRHAENLADVMKTLRKMFGRPEIVVSTLLDEIRRKPAPRLENLDTLVDFGLLVEEVCATVKSNGVENRFDGPLLQELVGRLPATLQLMWGFHCLTLPAPGSTLVNFGRWMETAKDAVLLLNLAPSGRREKSSTHVRHVNVHSETKPNKTPAENSCMCDDSCSTLADCEGFWRSSVAERWNNIRNRRLCKCCLRSHRDQCRTQRACGKDGCTAKHHPSLHWSNWKPNNAAAVSKPVQINVHKSLPEQENILLRHVPVTLHAAGRKVHTVALLDEGSSVTLVERGLLQELGVKGSHKPLCLSWTGGQHREEKDSMEAAVTISGTSERNLYEMAAVRTVRKLDLPPHKIDKDQLTDRYAYLQSLPISSFAATAPRMIIGMDNYHLTRPRAVVEGQPAVVEGEPVATKTLLGWVVSGRCREYDIDDPDAVPVYRINLCDCSNLEARMDAALKGSFALEEPLNRNGVILSSNDERAWQLLRATTKLVHGRFTTGLLWRHNDVKLPDSWPMAVKRLEGLEKRMNREIDLRDVMNAKIAEYLAKGYIRKITSEEKNTSYPRRWYLPVFPVYNPNKPNKVRIVWDAAAAVKGISLNTELLAGPDLLTPLTDVLQRFREYKVAVAADISEMYHQVVVNAEDQHSQRFLWRWKPEQEIPDEYVMIRMTFGASCSPSAAQYVKNMNAERFIDRHPQAVRCIKEDHYVDDMLTSVEEVAEATKLAKDVAYIHLQGGFPLHNWMSNSKEVLQSVGESGQGQKNLDLSAQFITQKILGMWWDPERDIFRFKVPAAKLHLLCPEVVPTKRQLLSTLMSIYDPLGLIAGLLFYLKVLLQEVWREGVNWDDAIPPKLHEKWRKWVERLPELEQVSIPRCYRKSTELSGAVTELHIFVDAGQDGFTAVAYFRIVQGKNTDIALIGGKTRVAPLKYASIPRLELQAAVVGTRLATSIARAHRERIDKRLFWTDSKDVICWLRSDHRRYSTFVAHRVGEILENTHVDEWRWVPTKHNVADEGTKWAKLEQHITTSQWFTGPAFLTCPEYSWDDKLPTVLVTQEEQRKTITFHAQAESFIAFDRFSRWRRLLRMVGYVWRFIHNARYPKQRQSGPLGSTELQRAERTIFKQAQQLAYPVEYKLLQEQLQDPQFKGTLPRGSPLVKRSAYMDEDGVIRVRGRIDACRYVGNDTKRPIILPAQGKVTELVVDSFHRRYRHTNHRTVMNEVRQRFDIPALRRVCHNVRSACPFCHIRSAMPTEPMMGSLPEARLSPFVRPFTFTGIDYFGPFIVTNGRKSEKRWGVLFTCLTVRAIHIEVAHSMSTNACILALRNFIARRGTPNQILSDRGTNFIGADRELREALKKVNVNEWIETMDLPDTQWIFNPPAAPHFGGAWERLVQTVKRTLYGVPLTRNPTDSIFQSWLIEVEMLVNSRPLIDVAVDREEDAPLTPNHFLLGSSSGAKPIVDVDSSTEVLRNTWKTSQVYTNEFWQRWIASYLPTLTKRSKWFQQTNPLMVGDIVLLLEEGLPRGCWPKGRIIKAMPATDGEVRRVSVQLGNGKVLERPSVKVVKLHVRKQ